MRDTVKRDSGNTYFWLRSELIKEYFKDTLQNSIYN